MNKTAPMVSVLCTAYNHDKFIRVALDSILMQRTTFPFEVIVHDDASSDGTTAIIREYAALHPDIIRPIFQTVNQFTAAPSHVVSLVNEAAIGRYVALCEGDDYWTDPLKLEKQVEVLEGDPSLSGVFHFTEQRFEGMEGSGRLFGSHEGKLRFTVEDTFSTNALCHYSAFMHRRASFTVPPWYGLVRSGDMVLFSLVAGRGDLLCIPEIMSVYRKHPDGVTTTAGHTGSAYHMHRILLWLFVDRHFNYKFSPRCKVLFLHHWDRILWQTSPRQRLNHWVRLFRTLPSWFLLHPRFSIARLWDFRRGYWKS